MKPVGTNCSFVYEAEKHSIIPYPSAESAARLAQPAERKALNLVVMGSSPTVGVSPASEIDLRCACAMAKQDQHLRSPQVPRLRCQLERRDLWDLLQHVPRVPRAPPYRRAAPEPRDSCARGNKSQSLRLATSSRTCGLVVTSPRVYVEKQEADLRTC